MSDTMTENTTYLERYQPRSLSDIHGHDTIRQVLSAMIEQKNVTHLMLVGTPGNGKSTTAMALIRDLYGDEYKSNYIKTDASSDRGIDVIRGRIKEATRYKSLNFPFKIILMEEADSLTPEAQKALRETMLARQNISRFIYICNDLSKIIEPIQDRCMILRFAPLTMEDITQHLKLIVKAENIDIKTSQISTIAGLADGSMRRAVNCLQSAATQTHITDKLIRTLLGSKLDPKYPKTILKNVFEGKEYESILFNLVYKEGFTPDEIMSGILDYLIKLNEPKNIKIILGLSEFHYRMSQGAQPMIQLRVGLAKLSTMKSPKF